MCVCVVRCMVTGRDAWDARFNHVLYDMYGIRYIVFTMYVTVIG